MTTQDLSLAIALLERTPRVLDTWLRDLPTEWINGNEGSETWNVFEVLGHLVHGERTDWMVRTRTLLEHGEARTFEPFNMEGHIKAIEGKSLANLLDEFARLRAENLASLRELSLGHDELEATGSHPAFGSVKLGDMLATWTVHDLTHLHQISRIMAHQFRGLVGPWSAYLGVLGGMK